MGWEDAIRPPLHELFATGATVPSRGGVDPRTSGLSPNHQGLAEAERLLRAIHLAPQHINECLQRCLDYLLAQVTGGHCFDEQCSSIYGLGGFHAEVVAGMTRGAVLAIERGYDGGAELYVRCVQWFAHELALYRLSIGGRLPGCRSGDSKDERRDKNAVQLNTGSAVVIPDGVNYEPRRPWHAVVMVGELLRSGDLAAIPEREEHLPRLRSTMIVAYRSGGKVASLRCPSLTCYGGPIWQVTDAGQSVSWRNIAPRDERGDPAWNGPGGGKSIGGGVAPRVIVVDGVVREEDVGMSRELVPLPDVMPPRLAGHPRPPRRAGAPPPVDVGPTDAEIGSWSLAELLSAPPPAWKNTFRAAWTPAVDAAMDAVKHLRSTLIAEMHRKPELRKGLRRPKR